MGQQESRGGHPAQAHRPQAAYAVAQGPPGADGQPTPTAKGRKMEKLLRRAQQLDPRRRERTTSSSRRDSTSSGSSIEATPRGSPAPRPAKLQRQASHESQVRAGVVELPGQVPMATGYEGSSGGQVVHPRFHSPAPLPQHTVELTRPSSPGTVFYDPRDPRRPGGSGPVAGSSEALGASKGGISKVAPSALPVLAPVPSPRPTTRPRVYNGERYPEELMNTEEETSRLAPLVQIEDIGLSPIEERSETLSAATSPTRSNGTSSRPTPGGSQGEQTTVSQSLFHHKPTGAIAGLAQSRPPRTDSHSKKPDRTPQTKQEALPSFIHANNNVSKPRPERCKHSTSNGVSEGVSAGDSDLHIEETALRVSGKTEKSADRVEEIKRTPTKEKLKIQIELPSRSDSQVENGGLDPDCAGGAGVHSTTSSSLSTPGDDVFLDAPLDAGHSPQGSGHSPMESPYVSASESRHGTSSTSPETPPPPLLRASPETPKISSGAVSPRLHKPVDAHYPVTTSRMLSTPSETPGHSRPPSLSGAELTDLIIDTIGCSPNLKRKKMGSESDLSSAPQHPKHAISMDSGLFENGGVRNGEGDNILLQGGGALHGETSTDRHLESAQSTIPRMGLSSGKARTRYMSGDYSEQTQSSPSSPTSSHPVHPGFRRRPPSRCTSVEESITVPPSVPTKLDFKQLEKFEGEFVHHFYGREDDELILSL